MDNPLILQLALFQVAAPIGLILLNAVIPTASMAGWTLRWAAILLLVLYASLAGIWLFPPWWTPMAYATLTLVLAYRQFRHLTRRAHARSAARFVEIGGGLIALAAAIVLLTPAIQGRTAPEVAIDLSMPLGPGRYLVISGGSTLTLNAHLQTLNIDRAAAFRGQSYGLDIIGIDRFGLRTTGISPGNPAAYAIYGADVVAPCEGMVLQVTDGVPDNRVPDMNRAAMTGNSIILECDGLAVVLAHFIPGSIAVETGALVTPGQKIAEVGNSGNSGEPHLHLHVQTLGPEERPIAGEPLWFTIDGRLTVRNMRFTVDN